jgi:hypothetical protein
MPMNPRLLRPTEGGFRSPDADARAYLAAVRQADGANLEPAVAKAISDFVIGLKDDGIWNAIGASCILMGARTLVGALTPLKGPSPTNSNFVDANYNRTTGLFGDGNSAAGKRIDTGYNGTTPGQDDLHCAWYQSVRQAGATQNTYISHQSVASAGGTGVFANNTSYILRNRSSSADFPIGTHTTGFVGMNRSNGSDYTFRSNGTTSSPISRASQSPTSGNFFVFGASNSVEARLSFYSVGTALSLSALDARVSALVTAISAALP